MVASLSISSGGKHGGGTDRGNNNNGMDMDASGARYSSDIPWAYPVPTDVTPLDFVGGEHDGRHIWELLSNYPYLQKIW